MANILEEVQHYVADKLNADPQLSACPFLVENRKDIDYEIKQALGKQGVVGLVMTPKATYIGSYMDVSLAWQIDELEIDVVENVTVNRGKKDGYVTGQDAAMRLFEVLCPLSGENEGQFSPVSYSEGEDNSLLVNRAVLKCLVHKAPAPSPAKTVVRYTDGRTAELDIQGELSANSIPDREYVLELRIGDEVTSVGNYAFDRCDQLETVVIPESVETIGTQGFSRTRRLTNVTIEGNGLKVIGTGAFAAATALTSISLPDSVVSVGRSAFEDCVSFTSIVIPASVQAMDREVFLGCSELMSATFSGKDKATVKGMENYSWALPSGCVLHCTDGDIVIGAETVVQYRSGLIRNLDIEGQLTYHSIPSVIYVKDVVIGNAVTSIDEGAFEQCHDLTSVTIPGSVKTIGDAAFLGCTALSSAVISEGVETIEGSAFTNCRTITNITIPSSVTSIGEDAFFSCEALSNVTFQGRTKAEVQAMENYPWGIENTQNIHSIIGPNTRVKYSWSQSWDSLPLSGTLNSNDLPSRDGIYYVGIGSSIDEIGYRAFRGMEFLTGVEIPDTVTAIGAQAFTGAEAMTDIEIPSSVSSIGSDAFFGCHMLSSVMFEGKTLEQVQAMANYPWGIRDASVIHAELD